MKYSQFNSILEYKDRGFVVYNSLVQKANFLDKALREILEQKIEEGIDNLQNIHPSFYEYLGKFGFLVNDDIDEIERVKEISRKIDENPHVFLLTINPTMNCNFKCWYCYETHIRNSRPEKQTSLSIKNLISNIADNPLLQKFNLSFFGGEPLLYFKQDVIPIIDHYLSVCEEKKLSTNISFTTNGYLVKDDLVNYFKKAGINPSFQITFDGCKEDHDTVRYLTKAKGSYNVIVQNIRKLIEAGFFVRARINYTDKNIHNILQIVDDFEDIQIDKKNKNLVFDFHRVWQNDASDDISDIMKENARKRISDFS